MSQPIAITFHFPHSSSTGNAGPSSRTLSKRKIASNNRILASSYITIDKASRPNKLTPTPASAQSSITSPPDTSSSSSSSETVTTVLSTGSKRRKGPVFLPPSDVKLASLTPLLKPIVNRCTTSATQSEESLVVHASPTRKRSKKSTPVPSISAPSTLHPYSKSSDLSNTRSSVPSPREIARNKRLEEEKAALKKQNAAIARANAIAKRKSNRKIGSGGRGGKSQSRRSSFEATTTVASKPSSPEGKNSAVPVITTQAASEDGSPVLGSRPNGMKRTRSHGVLPISTSLTNSINGSPVIGSPLKEVMSRDQDEEGNDASKKKSKLSDSIEGGEGEARTSRRANTHSPTSNSFDLPDQERLMKTVPLSHGKVLPPKAVSIESGIGLRRSVSNTIPYGRSGSVVSVGSNTSENGRTRRETQLPERLRDYEMKASV
ncbi:uncharacterized protein I206_106218 [Kwoniella pini CBS 10737]|uniref:Uncharacterized protein n=1 Tax=Kwoniella pini CBS 10737 TaxID=1296096 RepID=A0A1B9I1M1_9TREE|nr:uncharacterized protein I206_05044 [Kwoniella pini CBS 10737]OCF49351.1 hypothetical protein I206_05044 [Kwoniella pini CBS 10737]